MGLHYFVLGEKPPHLISFYDMQGHVEELIQSGTSYTADKHIKYTELPLVY
jgi:hypothetical protein